MKLYDFILKLNYEASQLPNMGMICDGDIYELNHYQNVKYPAFCATQLQHSEAGDWRYYQFNLFYVDRLTSSHGNAQQIQSAAIDALSKIIKNMTRYVETQGSVLYDVFTERFDSECAGAYATVTFMTLVSDTCPDWFNFGWDAKNIKVLRYTWTSRNQEAETPSMTNAVEAVNQGDDPLDYGFESYFNLPQFIGNIVYQGRSNNGNNYSVVYTDASSVGITWVNADWLIYDSATEGHFTSIDLSEADSPDCTLYVSCGSNLRTVILPDNLAGLGSLKNAGITNLTIPSSVTWMGDVFDGCQRITRATYRGTKEQFLSIPKSDNWSGNSTIQYIYCTDGRICLRDCEEGYTGATVAVANQINCREVEVDKVTGIGGATEGTYLIARIGVPTRATRRTSDGKFVFVNDSAKDGMIVNNRIGRYPLFKLDFDEETGLYRFADAETGLWLNVTSGLSSFVSDVSGATLMGVGDGFIGVGYNDETGDYDYILGYNNDGLAVALPYGSDNTFDLYGIIDACGGDPYYGCTYDEQCEFDQCKDDCYEDNPCEDCQSDNPCPTDGVCTEDNPCPTDGVCTEDGGCTEDAPCVDCQSDCEGLYPCEYTRSYRIMNKITSSDQISQNDRYIFRTDNGYTFATEWHAPRDNNAWPGYIGTGETFEGPEILLTIPSGHICEGYCVKQYCVAVCSAITNVDNKVLFTADFSDCEYGLTSTVGYGHVSEIFEPVWDKPSLEIGIDNDGRLWMTFGGEKRYLVMIETNDRFYFKTEENVLSSDTYVFLYKLIPVE